MSQNPIAEPTSKVPGFLTLAFVRDVLSILFLIVLSWKLIESDFGFTVETLSLTDIMFLLLALFSIGLSVAFYFKASDTSNQFYQQTHTFTKETSELLGRVESGLVERLGSLDKNYNTITTGMLSIAQNGYSERGGKGATLEELVTEKEQVIDQKESEISEREEALQAVVEELMSKAKLNDEEKAKTREQLEEKERELRLLRAELRVTKSEEPAFVSASKFEEIRALKIARVIGYLVGEIRRRSEKFGSRESINMLQARMGFREVRDFLAPEALRDLAVLGLMEGQVLSREAAMLVVEAWNA